ncbi:hypothetical protein NEOLEDRAFT_1113285 [Neolentinus lepideus HHB14362 ss-1]|uniref:Uncharacterized protein n=1 Tax=Neolentinus lepideus HHB14362 ss-1 TaxID=1314782 RepID=A0A165T236_9AGAM|nr:hypothetical protein NEOLEDRAFT_1113285 [Neolentinus lepideus HHB14362 ss-1]
MSGDDHSLRLDKGKQRATAPEPDERAPLLGGPSLRVLNDEEHTHHSRRRLWSKLCAVFVVSFLLCTVLFLSLLVYSYRARAEHLTPEDVINRGLYVAGPDRVDVLNITAEEGIWVRVDGRIGVDAGLLMDVRRDEEEDGFFDEVKKGLGRWGIRRLRTVTVDSMTAEILSQYGQPILLATVTTAPVELPLTVDRPRDLSWLTNISIPILIQPTRNGSALLDFARHSWRDGFANIRAAVNHVQVHGGGLTDNGWRSRLRLDRPNVCVNVRKKIPELPGLPSPGEDFPPAEDLVTLKTFSVSSTNESLRLDALATFVNPVPPNIHFAAPELPFIISLLNESIALPVASIHTNPFNLTHPNITLSLFGSVLPLPSTVTPVLSSFLSRYLSGQSNPVQIASLLLSDLSVDTFFPAPHPKPQILRDVTIRDMKIMPSGPGGNAIAASGTVFARAVLPKGMDVSLSVNRVWPDVLVYDGEVPDVREDGELPEGAFAHIKPEDWLLSESHEEAPGEEGAVFAVTARIEDVPLEVLPGREKEFSHFVSKVIWGPSGALAGVQGVAAVAVKVHGLPFSNGTEQDSEMELTDLPFRGRVRIGKKGL